jgi:hypothetical protein
MCNSKPTRAEISYSRRLRPTSQKNSEVPHVKGRYEIKPKNKQNFENATTRRNFTTYSLWGLVLHIEKYSRREYIGNNSFEDQFRQIGAIRKPRPDNIIQTLRKLLLRRSKQPSQIMGTPNFNSQYVKPNGISPPTSSTAGNRLGKAVLPGL